MPNVGPWEIVLLLLLALLLFGAKRLPEIGKSVGQGMREFKDSVSGASKQIDEVRAELETSLNDPTDTTVSAASREHDTV